MLKRCPSCKSNRVVKIGFMDGKQRYRCTACWETFYDPKDYAAKTKRRSRWFL